MFEVTPPEIESVATVTPELIIEGEHFDKELIEIDYAHVPKQSILLPSKAKVVRMDIKKEGESIGYIVGAGDNAGEVSGDIISTYKSSAVTASARKRKSHHIIYKKAR